MRSHIKRSKRNFPKGSDEAKMDFTMEAKISACAEEKTPPLAHTPAAFDHSGTVVRTLCDRDEDTVVSGKNHAPDNLSGLDKGINMKKKITGSKNYKIIDRVRINRDVVDERRKSREDVTNLFCWFAVTLPSRR